MDKNSIPQNCMHFPGELTDEQSARFAGRGESTNRVFYEWFRSEEASLDAFFAKKRNENPYPIKRVQFKWAGVPGYYSRQTMWADVIGREVWKGIVWLYIQPDCLNLPRWIKGSDILSFEMPLNVPISDIYDEMGRWQYGASYVSQVPGAGAYESGRGGTFKSWLQSEYGNTYGAGR